MDDIGRHGKRPNAWPFAGSSASMTTKLSSRSWSLLAVEGEARHRLIGIQRPLTECASNTPLLLNCGCKGALCPKARPGFARDIDPGLVAAIVCALVDMVAGKRLRAGDQDLIAPRSRGGLRFQNHRRFPRPPVPPPLTVVGRRYFARQPTPACRNSWLRGGSGQECVPRRSRFDIQPSRRFAVAHPPRELFAPCPDCQSDRQSCLSPGRPGLSSSV